MSASIRSQTLPTTLTRRDVLSLTALGPLALTLSRHAVAQTPGGSLPPLDAAAGTWQTWLAASVIGLRPAAPPAVAGQSTPELRELLDFQARRGDATNALVRFWDAQGGLPRWSQILPLKFRETRISPVRAARALALFHTAIADATICCWEAKFAYRRAQPSRIDSSLAPAVLVDDQLPPYPSEHAVVAAAAATVLNYLFPAQTAVVHDRPLTFGALANEAALSRLWAGTNYRSDLETGIRMGQAVAWTVIQRGQNDGSSAVWNMETQPGRLGATPPHRETAAPYWSPTPPTNAFPPLEPLAGYWNPWILESPSQFRAPTPPALQGAFPSETFLKETQEVKDMVDSIRANPDRLKIAESWADGNGTPTPAGHWLEIALAHVADANLSVPRAARALALVSAGLFDSAVACWDSKYAYWVMRPITAIRTMQGHRFYGPGWLSPIATPPFPAYTSGHSTFSGCSAAVLEYLFPGGKTANALGQSVSFTAAAEEAMMSRLYGGIHYRSDNEEGLACGRNIAGLVIRRAQHDGAH
jgi:membrane-associated phospholipid phosphatase